MKVDQLTEPALDWAVQQCEGQRTDIDFAWWWEDYSPSTNWAQGGAIIEREGISLSRRGEHSWSVWGAVLNDFEFDEEGETPLIAAMRGYVASKLGDEVELPEELA